MRVCCSACECVHVRARALYVYVCERCRIQCVQKGRSEGILKENLFYVYACVRACVLRLRVNAWIQMRA